MDFGFENPNGSASSGVPTSRTITAGTGLSGGGNLSADRTLALANSGVTAGSYSAANITVNAKGQVTAAADGATGGGGDTVTTLADGATVTTGGRYYLPPGAAATLDIADGVAVSLRVGGSGVILPNTAGPWRVLGGGDAGSSLFVAAPALLECWRVSNRMMYVEIPS